MEKALRDSKKVVGIKKNKADQAVRKALTSNMMERNNRHSNCVRNMGFPAYHLKMMIAF